MPQASSPEALKRMREQKRAGTVPELAIRRLVHERGLRYRVDALLPIDGIKRRADMLFPRARVAVFVDGCYWHACPAHGTRPKANHEWWSEKLDSNVQRDRDTDRRLDEQGWTVVRIWEHESPLEAAERVIRSVAHSSSS